MDTRDPKDKEVSDNVADRTQMGEDGRLIVRVDDVLVDMLSQLMPDITEKQQHDKDEPPPPYTVEDDKNRERERGQPPATEAGPSSQAALPLRLNIVIQVVGSRGDVQPFVALGSALQAVGHRVRLATHGVFEAFVREAGLDFFSVGGDPSELMAYMVRNPGLIPSLASLRDGEIQKKRCMVAAMLDGFWRSCVEADPQTGAPFVAEAIIANPPSYAHVHCAQALAIPLHLMFTMPWTSTRQFPHPLANLQSSSSHPPLDKGCVNQVSYSVVSWVTWQGLSDVVNDWRVRTLELEPVPFSRGPQLAETLHIPMTYCWSPALVPQPRDWAANIDVCGFFFRSPPAYSPPADLDDFLRAGPPPVYIGFGSIVIDDPEALAQTLLKAIETAGVRAIVSKGWSRLGGDQVGLDWQHPNVFFLNECPHEWLFAHVSAVVHHGGAGTTACGLRNGRPTVIVPFFGDQPFWGDMVAAAGAGPRPIPHKQLTAASLALALFMCLTPEVTRAARDLAVKVQADGGVNQAVASFHAQVLRAGGYDKLRCDLLPSQPATWRYQASNNGRTWQLSKLAAEVLADHLLLEKDRLQPLSIKPIAIENGRWDPVTAATSSLFSTTKGIVEGATTMVRQSMEVYQQAQDSASMSSETGSGARKGPSGLETTAKMAVASASGASMLFRNMTKGFLLDIPLAAAEGLRNVPPLYGGVATELGAIDGVLSGTAVAGKQFAQGMAGGFSDLVTEPVRGAREQGALGAALGFGKGITSFSTKVTAAPLGLFAYSVEGVYQSLRRLSAQRAKAVGRNQQAEGVWQWQQAQRAGRSAEVAGQVLQMFREKLHEKT